MSELAAIAVTASAVDDARAALSYHGAQDIAVHSLGPNRFLACGQFDEATARDVVAILRRRGWAAIERPSDDDPRIVAWKNRTRPICIRAGRLMVGMPWAEFDRTSSMVLEIDPGGAFGAGTHPTSQLLLEALAERLQGGETVLDIGCGSGVLALAAVRLGAASAVGIDIETAAVIATQANARRNGLDAQVMALDTPLQELDGRFDVIVANILQDTLIDLAADIEARLSPGGWLGLSGISPAQISRLAAAFPNTHMVVTPRLDDWSAMVRERRPA